MKEWNDGSVWVEIIPGCITPSSWEL